MSLNAADFGDSIDVDVRVQEVTPGWGRDYVSANDVRKLAPDVRLIHPGGDLGLR